MSIAEEKRGRAEGCSKPSGLYSRGRSWLLPKRSIQLRREGIALARRGLRPLRRQIPDLQYRMGSRVLWPGVRIRSQAIATRRVRVAPEVETVLPRRCGLLNEQIERVRMLQ